MGNISKGFSLLIVVILAVSSCMMVESASAQSIPKPSVPEFKVQIVSDPYIIPETNSTDPYTGQVTIYPAHINENKSVIVTIKNQQFHSTQLPDGNWTTLYYNIRYEGHFITNDWKYYPLAPDSGYLNASQSDYTAIAIPWLTPAGYSNGSKMDFQVQALIGHDASRYIVSGNTGELVSIGNKFSGTVGDWSPSQTLVFGEPLNINPTPSPTVPEFSWLAILPLFLSLLSVVVILRHRNPISQTKPNV